MKTTCAIFRVSADSCFNTRSASTIRIHLDHRDKSAKKRIKMNLPIQIGFFVYHCSWYVVLDVILLCQEELVRRRPKPWDGDKIEKNDGGRSIFKMDPRCHRDRNNVRPVG